MSVRVTFLGSGDAFGSGGRMHACFLLETSRSRYLIDCGATSPTAIRSRGVDPNEIEAILVSHLHGDHFGGIPFLLLDAQFVSERTEPLTIAGPRGTGKRLERAMEILYPGASVLTDRFEVDLLELKPGRTSGVHGLTVTPFLVSHPSGAPPLALRIECDGKVIAYTGDTEWTDSLLEAGRDADLLIAEAYRYDEEVAHHLDYRTLSEHLDEINPKRLVVTHMGEEMLARRGSLACEFAEDGLTIEL